MMVCATLMLVLTLAAVASCGGQSSLYLGGNEVTVSTLSRSPPTHSSYLRDWRSPFLLARHNKNRQPQPKHLARARHPSDDVTPAPASPHRSQQTETTSSTSPVVYDPDFYDIKCLELGFPDLIMPIVRKSILAANSTVHITTTPQIIHIKQRRYDECVTTMLHTLEYNYNLIVREIKYEVTTDDLDYRAINDFFARFDVLLNHNNNVNNENDITSTSTGRHSISISHYPQVLVSATYNVVQQVPTTMPLTEVANVVLMDEIKYCFRKPAEAKIVHVAVQLDTLSLDLVKRAIAKLWANRLQVQTLTIRLPSYIFENEGDLEMHAKDELTAIKIALGHKYSNVFTNARRQISFFQVTPSYLPAKSLIKKAAARKAKKNRDKRQTS